MLNFELMRGFNYSLTEMDEMLPYEREIYTALLIQHLEEQRKKAK